MSFKLLIAVEKKLARKVLLVSGNYAPRRPICEKSGNQTISSPKWSIRFLVTLKKKCKKYHRSVLQDPLKWLISKYLFLNIETSINLELLGKIAH